jgi:hypothetical protein
MSRCECGCLDSLVCLDFPHSIYHMNNYENFFTSFNVPLYITFDLSGQDDNFTYLHCLT